MYLRLREALVQWKEYARVLEVLEMETETHLLNQVKLFAPPLSGCTLPKGMFCRLPAGTVTMFAAPFEVCGSASTILNSLQDSFRVDRDQPVILGVTA